MTGLICGLLDFGQCPHHEELTSSLAQEMCAGVASNIDVQTAGDASFAQCEIAPSNPEAAAVLRSGDKLLCGNFDLIFRRGCDKQRGVQHVASDLLAGASNDGPLPFDGEFAYAHWDGAGRTLSLVRDRAGTRPLFYVHKPGAWCAFASLPGALRAAALASDALDEETLARWSLTYSEHGTRTHFTDISRVLPAHIFEITAERVRQTRYWKPSIEDPLSTTMDYAEMTAELRARVRRAVQRRLPAHGSVYSHLSGGLDSTSVAAMIASIVESDGRKVVGYAFEPEEIEGSPVMVTEIDAAEATRDAFPNIELRLVPGIGFKLVDSRRYQDEFPQGDDPDFVYERLLSDAADKGASVVFSGFGGDEVASYDGRAAMAHLLREGHWWPLLRALPKRRATWWGVRPFLSTLERVIEAPWLTRLAALFNRRKRDRQSMARYLGSELRTRVLGSVPRDQTDVHVDMVQRFCDGRLGLLAEELAWRAARHGLCYSFPLMDTDVVEYAVRIPPAFHLRGPMRRVVYRDAMEGVLPDPVRFREAKLFANPATVYYIAGDRDRYLEALAGLRGSRAEAVFDLDEIEVSIRALPDPEAVRRSLGAEARAGRQYNPGGLHFLWPLVVAGFIARHGRA